jgi:1-acyl-sn-glycerol-3-phosphate acyltransferase
MPLSRHERPRVAWYGKMSLAPHLSGLARGGGIDVTVLWGEPVAFDEQSDRKQVARALEAQVRRRTVQTLRGRSL